VHRFRIIAARAVIATRVAQAALIMIAAAALFLQAAQPALAQSANGIIVPVDGATVRGPVSIVAVADSADFRKWQLDLLGGGEGAPASFLGVGEEARPTAGFLQTLDTTAFPDGDYLLRLRVARTDLNYDEYYASITIANQVQPAASAGALSVLGDQNRLMQLVTLPIVVPPVPAAGAPLQTESAPQQAVISAAASPFRTIAPLVDPVKAATQAGANSGKRIEVSISDQTLTAWEGDKLFMRTSVSTGKPGWRTLPGTFAVYSKFVETRMTGEDYDTPDVPWTMYYSGDFAIHGAYWHDNFGSPVSHGCVNLRVPEAQALYAWADMGTRVVVNE